MDGIIIEREDQAVRSVAITQPIHNSCKYLTQQESGHNYFHLGEPEHVAQRWAVQGCDGLSRCCPIDAGTHVRTEAPCREDIVRRKLSSSRQVVTTRGRSPQRREESCHAPTSN